MLGASYISAVIGNRLPGPGSIYLSQSLQFRRPVRSGDPLIARVTIKALGAAKGHATPQTVCQVGGKTVIEGEAGVVVPQRNVSGRVAFDSCASSSAMMTC